MLQTALATWTRNDEAVFCRAGRAYCAAAHALHTLHMLKRLAPLAGAADSPRLRVAQSTARDAKERERGAAQRAGASRHASREGCFQSRLHVRHALVRSTCRVNSPAENERARLHSCRKGRYEGRARLLLVLGGSPEGEIVAQQLHDEGRVLVAVLVEPVELGNGRVEGRLGERARRLL